MEVQELIDCTADELVRRIQSSNALAVFARRRAKFEGWLKVELIDILLKYGVKDVVPEEGRIDVSFGNVAIELKTVNTNYRDGIAASQTRPITKNIKGVIEDIKKHRTGKSKAFSLRYIIFIVFPLNEETVRWNVHLTRIENDLGNACHPRYFTFGKQENCVSGCLYYGQVSERELIC